jgi:aldose 1-epimerase
MQSTPDTEITLARAGRELVVSPYGASLRGLYRVGEDGARTEIIAGYTGAQGKVGGQGDVLIPFPGRVAAGRYSFNGQTYQMEKNDKEGPNAIHGFVRQTLWQTEQPGPDEVTFTTNIAADAHPGYPFALGVRVTYHLTETGMACAFVIENTGDKPAPVAAGFHPYFTVGTAQIDTATLEVPFEATLEYENLIPTGRTLPVGGTDLDFRVPHPIGTVQFNTCYLQPRRDPDGHVRIRLSDPATGKSLAVWLDKTFDYAVLYSGDPLPEPHRRRALAIEPMTCGSDAFNHPEWGLAALAPGETLSGTWGVTAE